MTQEVGNLKLFKVSGFYVKDFYLLAIDEEQAGQEARGALTFRITECKVEELDCKIGFWKRLFGR
jgi:hypothetical protein